MNAPDLIPVTGLTNREFLETYAKPGRVGLVSGVTLLEKVIRRAERHVDEQQRWSLWSHAMLFQGPRVDGRQWVIESDLDIHRRHIRLGVQENRVDKYHDAAMFPVLAVLDFRLTDAQTARLLGEALEMVATRSRYSLRELVGTLVGLRHPRLRPQPNLLARERSMYCSAFVQHVFQRTGIELVPGVHASQNTPEDISRTPVPHTTYVLERAK